jgi:hypothetical protein
MSKEVVSLDPMPTRTLDLFRLIRGQLYRSSKKNIFRSVLCRWVGCSW